MVPEDFVPDIIKDPKKPSEDPIELPDPNNPQPPGTPYSDRPEKDPVDLPPNPPVKEPPKARS